MFFLSFSDVLLWHLLQELSSTVCTRLRESPSVKLHPAILYLAVHVSDIFFFFPIVTDINHLVLFFHLLKIHLHFFSFFSFPYTCFVPESFFHIWSLFIHLMCDSNRLHYTSFFFSLNRISIFVSYILWKQITAY